MQLHIIKPRHPSTTPQLTCQITPATQLTLDLEHLSTGGNKFVFSSPSLKLAFLIFDTDYQTALNSLLFKNEIFHYRRLNLLTQPPTCPLANPICQLTARIKQSTINTKNRPAIFMPLGNCLDDIILQPKHDIDLIQLAKSTLLTYLHTALIAGYLHRDIKPKNFILIKGQVKLIDWATAFPIKSPNAEQNGATYPSTRFIKYLNRQPGLELDDLFADQPATPTIRSHAPPVNRQLDHIYPAPSEKPNITDDARGLLITLAMIIHKHLCRDTDETPFHCELQIFHLRGNKTRTLTSYNFIHHHLNMVLKCFQRYLLALTPVAAKTPTSKSLLSLFLLMGILMHIDIKNDTSLRQQLIDFNDPILQKKHIMPWLKLLTNPMKPASKASTDAYPDTAWGTAIKKTLYTKKNIVAFKKRQQRKTTVYFFTHWKKGFLTKPPATKRQRQKTQTQHAPG